MYKMPVEEFIQEVIAEIAGYEELGKDTLVRWEQEFRNLLGKGLLCKDIWKQEKGKDYILLKDESELFEFADTYWLALENEEEDQYWEGLR